MTLQEKVEAIYNSIEELGRDIASHIDKGEAELQSYKPFFARNFGDLKTKLGAIETGINQLKTGENK